MGKGYLSYIVYVSFLLVVLSVLVFSLFYRIKKNKSKIHLFEEITCGSVSIFFDRDKNATIIPYVTGKYGVGKALNKILQLDFPYKAEKLGKAVRDAMLLCVDGVSGSNKELMSLLKSFDWKEFTEGKRNISVYYKEGYGIVFNSTKRKYDGGYEFNNAGFDKVLPSTAKDCEIGELVLSLVRYCRY